MKRSIVIGLALLLSVSFSQDSNTVLTTQRIIGIVLADMDSHDSIPGFYLLVANNRNYTLDGVNYSIQGTQLLTGIESQWKNFILSAGANECANPYYRAYVGAADPDCGPEDLAFSNVAGMRQMNQRPNGGYLVCAGKPREFQPGEQAAAYSYWQNGFTPMKDTAHRWYTSGINCDSQNKTANELNERYFANLTETFYWYARKEKLTLQNLEADFGITVEGEYVYGGYCDEFDDDCSLGGDDGNGGDGSGGGGSGGNAIVEPGNCEDGWFLTNIVCEIRTTVNDTYVFVTHDAWVSETDHSQTWLDFRNRSQQKIPFGFLAVLDINKQGSEDVGIHVPGYIADTGSIKYTFPGYTLEVPEASGLPNLEIPRTEVDFADNAIMQWQHDTGRQWMWWFLLAGTAISITRNFVDFRTQNSDS